MLRVRVHLYYRVDVDRDTVEVVAAWNATSGSDPDF
jgi:hypothetical protein